MKFIKKYNDMLQFALILISVFSAIFFIIGLCMYGDWVRTLKLYNAGLLSEYSVEFNRITRYEPAIKAMAGGAIFGIINLSLLAIAKKIKNENEA